MEAKNNEQALLCFLLYLLHWREGLQKLTALFHPDLCAASVMALLTSALPFFPMVCDAAEDLVVTFKCKSRSLRLSEKVLPASNNPKRNISQGS
jgi:hypothetical protein